MKRWSSPLTLLALGCIAGCIEPLQTPGATPPPALVETLPPSPAPERIPLLRGRAGPHEAVYLFASPDCGEGTEVARTVADAEGLFEVRVTAIPGAATAFTARAKRPGRRLSTDCGVPLVYVQDETAPAPPQWDTAVQRFSKEGTDLAGSAEPGARVDVFVGERCEGPPAWSVLTAAGRFAFAATLPPDTTALLRATATDAAGNVSECGAVMTLVRDNTPPADPIFVSYFPKPPAHTALVQISFLASPGVTVELFAIELCAGQPVGMFSVGESGAGDLWVAVTPDSRHNFSLLATDEAGNYSACVDLPGFEEDSTPPSFPAFKTLRGNTPDATWVGTVEPAATMSFHLDAECATPGVQVPAENGSVFATIGPFEPGTTAPIYATLQDFQGNSTGCAILAEYVYDDAPPEVTAIEPPGPLCVDPGAAPVLRFSEPVAALPESFAVFENGLPVAALDTAPGYSDELRYIPAFLTLQPETEYTYLLRSANISDRAGNRLGSDLTGSFRTCALGWTGPKSDATAYAGYLPIGAIAPNGDRVLLWIQDPARQGDHALYERRMSGSTLQWRGAVRAVGSRQVNRLGVAFGPAGDGLVVLGDDTELSAVYFDGTAWGPLQQVSALEPGASHLDVVAAEAGVFWVMWTDGPSSDLRVAKFSGTSGWSSPILLAFGTEAPAIAAAPDGTVVAAWIKPDGVHVGRFAAGAWQLPVPLAEPGGPPGSPPSRAASVGIAADGTSTVAWTRTEGSPPQTKLFAIHGAANAPWNAAQLIAQTGSAGGFVMAVAPTGRAAVAFQDADVFEVYEPAQGWAPQPIPPKRPRSLAADAEGGFWAVDVGSVPGGSYGSQTTLFATRLGVDNTWSQRVLVLGPCEFAEYGELVTSPSGVGAWVVGQCNLGDAVWVNTFR